MGDRAQLTIRGLDSAFIEREQRHIAQVEPERVITLYTHWHGSALAGLLASALDSREARARWSDDSYLARIIVTRIVHYAGDCDSETGWGLGFPDTLDGGEGNDIDIDVNAQTVDGVPFETFIARNLERAGQSAGFHNG